VIVVIGSPVGRSDDGVVVAAGMASRIALAAAAAARTVQLVGKIGDDPLHLEYRAARQPRGLDRVGQRQAGKRLPRERSISC